MKAYYINLDRSIDRREAFEKQCPSFIDLERVRAIDGSVQQDIKPFRSHVPEYFLNGTKIKPGAFGLFMSHLKVWEKIASSNDDEPALVMEDDGRIIADEASFKSAVKLLKRDNLEILLVNKKSSLWLRKLKPEATETVSIDSAVKSFAPYDDLPRNAASIGTDGYILSKSGARRLLEFTYAHGACCGVDAFFVFLSISLQADLDKWPLVKAGRIRGVIAKAPQLNCAILPNPLTRITPGSLGKTTIHIGQLVDLSSYIED